MSNKFNEIFLKSKTIPQSFQKGYKVYTEKDKFQLIEAQTVAEAIEKSGVLQPYKVEPAGIIKRSIFTPEEIIEKQSNSQNTSTTA